MPLRDGCIQTIITSPPYWGLRDYGLSDGIGLEPTLDAYIENMRAVGRECWRVLRDDGTLWLNMGDCHVAAQGGRQSAAGLLPMSPKRTHGKQTARADVDVVGWGKRDVTEKVLPSRSSGLKPKDIIGLPWRVAFALQADGWWLRSDIIENVEFYCPCGCGYVMEERIWRYSQDRDIIWAKPNPMPESARDRPTRSHEYIFLLTKRARYYYDAEAIKEVSVTGDMRRPYAPGQIDSRGDGHDRGGGQLRNDHEQSRGRNRRSVWTIATQPYPKSHFATFPEKLVEPCILAGTSPKACGVCGAPWERELETTYRNDTTKDGRPAGGDGHKTTEGGLVKNISGGQRTRRIATTLGWHPTCDHEDDTGSCLVLDPFCGSGTVGAVARRFGRRFVGCDLSAVYLELARERIGAVTQGMRLL